ncbi:MAG: type II toxin-antitoxin system VapC family toxin [Boseongicola sp. SB0676_bin_33]|nr:type II toxin-antitoxin system VapC family toxin [Boseongicola sp. SB0676_bin_33]
MDEQPTQRLFVTAVAEAAIRAGAAILPEGARRRGLADTADRTLGFLFAGRFLPFDSNAVRAQADIFDA